MNELALFAGAGGGILGGQLLGWKTVCAVEREAYAAAVLAQRQNDGLLDLFPIWSDVCTFDGKQWRGIVDVISGGFPCQDISCAGKGAGIDGEKSGLWSEFYRIIREVQPSIVYVENSPMLTNRGLGRVLGDLAEIGYNAEWGVLGASSVGAHHKRERIWIVAHSTRNGYRQGREERNIYKKDGRQDRKVCSEFTGTSEQSENMANTYGTQCEREQLSERSTEKHTDISSRSWWETEPDVGRVANGVAFSMDRLKAIGNGQVPQCAAEAFRQLLNRIKEA